MREWDDASEAWADTTRTTIYPALEDTEVEVAVALADGVELTNDTFVTPKKLSLRSDGELHIDVPEGSSTTNATVAFTGSLKLVKDGDGTFTAVCAKQSYTGGTEIADGTLKLGTSNLPLGAKNASVKICAGAVYDMNGRLGKAALPRP